MPSSRKSFLLKSAIAFHSLSRLQVLFLHTADSSSTSAYSIWGLSCHILTLALSLHSGAAYTYLRLLCFPPCSGLKNFSVEIPFHTMASILKKDILIHLSFYLLALGRIWIKRSLNGRYRTYCNSTREAQPLSSTEPPCWYIRVTLGTKPHSPGQRGALEENSLKWLFQLTIPFHIFKFKELIHSEAQCLA